MPVGNCHILPTIPLIIAIALATDTSKIGLIRVSYDHFVISYSNALETGGIIRALSSDIEKPFVQINPLSNNRLKLKSASELNKINSLLGTTLARFN